jgi:hypothetical protein
MPELKSVKKADNGLTLRWGSVEGAEGYCVYRRLEGGGWTRIGTVTNSKTMTYTDTTAETGVHYYYTVRGYKTVNKVRNLGPYDATGISGVR